MIDGQKIEDSKKFSKEIVQMIANNVRRIQDRVKGIADAVKGETNPPNFAPCQVASIVGVVFETLRFYSGEKGVSLLTEGLETLPPIQADERRLCNALYNLINNAIPEVPPGGAITVRGYAEEKENRVVLSVTDTGRGMPPDVRDSLFTPSRKAGGTGLGTKIVKDVVDAHGGRITVESEERVGTTFHVSVPIQRPR